MSKFHCRRVSTDDPERIAELTALHRVCFTTSTPTPNFEEGAWWIVEDERNKIGGFAGVSFVWTCSEYPRHAYLVRIGLQPSLQGKGLGKRLIRLRERCARQFRAPGLVTYTTNDAVASINNLIACGFRVFIPKAPWGFKRDCIYWKKDF